MGWRPAGSLIVLRYQVDAAYPGRDKASDGIIGDAAHAASASDHNPDGQGIVRALDITHDPAHGCDISALSDALAASRDERISYIIANRAITGPEYGWQWCAYHGNDPHTGHLHLSIVGDSRADITTPWNIALTHTNGSIGKDLTEDTVVSMIRYEPMPEVFLTDGVTARHITSEAEIGDLRTLHDEGTIRLGYDARVRVVTRRELIGRIIGTVPAGWEDLAA